MKPLSEQVFFSRAGSAGPEAWASASPAGNGSILCSACGISQAKAPISRCTSERACQGYCKGAGAPIMMTARMNIVLRRYPAIPNSLPISGRSKNIAVLPSSLFSTSRN